MKLRHLLLTTTLAIVTILSTGCQQKNSNLQTVKVNEVAHSIFYAPQYVAYELGYFKDEGLDVTIETGFGADKTMTALITGSADIGFMGPEATVYAYTQGAKDYAVNFAQLTQRAGNFLVAREPMEQFSWADVKGKTIIGGRAGGMPEMILEYILTKHNIIPGQDVEIIQNIDFGVTAGAFSSGTGDFTVEFEPGATALELEKKGYVVASLGVDSGYVPYTAYCAKKSYIADNPGIIKAFTAAIEKGQKYVNEHTAEEVAKIIAPQFPDSDESTIAIIIDRYKAQDTWKTDCVFSKEAFELLEDILINAGELDNKTSYEDLVINPHKL